MLKQMQTTIDDIEIESETFGMNDFTLKEFRDDLLSELNQNRKKYEEIPNAVFTGFKVGTSKAKEQTLVQALSVHSKEKSSSMDRQECLSSPKNALSSPKNTLSSSDYILLALLGYPNKPTSTKNWNYKDLRLVYIDSKGNTVLKNEKEILRFLKVHNDLERNVPKGLDDGKDVQLVKDLSISLKNYLTAQFKSSHEDESKKIVGQGTLDLLDSLKSGNKSAFERLKENIF